MIESGYEYPKQGKGFNMIMVCAGAARQLPGEEPARQERRRDGGRTRDEEPDRGAGSGGRGGTGPRSSIAAVRGNGGQAGVGAEPGVQLGLATTWALMLRIWPLEDRPEEMVNPEIVNALSFDQILKYKKHYEAQIKREGKGEGVFGRDASIPTVQFDVGEDNCMDKLHPARFQRLPVTERKKWWHLVPVKRAHTYRRLALVHAGAEGKVSECVIVRAHDRSLPLKIKMFFSSNRTQKCLGSSETKEAAQDWDSPKVLLDVQEAILNLADIYADLWPEDDMPRVMSRVLVHHGYGAAVKGSEAERCRLILQFCDSLLRDNACRAVVREPGLSFRRAKEKWSDLVERFNGAGGKGVAAEYKAADGGAGFGRGRASGNQNKRGGGGGSSFGGGASRGGAQVRGRGARYFAGGASFPVCFDFNRVGGCTKRTAKGCGCDDGKGGVFAHACNHFSSIRNQYCLAMHSREGNH